MQKAAEDMGLDRGVLGSFRNGNRHTMSVQALDKIVAWLDEQDALDEQARKGL